MKTLVCMKWGNRYPSDFANRLFSMVKRNMQSPFRLVCYTDDFTGLDPGIEAYPLPPIVLPLSHALLPWRKISLWAPSLPGLEGDVLFLDLDIIITGKLDPFFDYKPEETFCVAENWTQYGSGIGNTSVYRFKVGSHPYLYHQLQDDPAGVLEKFPNSQTYISKTIRAKEFWPDEWCSSFKHSLLPRWPLNFFKTAELPPDTKVVAFTGRPDPDEVLEGRWTAPWYKKWYKHVKPTPWVAEHWR